MIADTKVPVVIFAPGDAGSASYRIPALAKCNDGTLLAICDQRINNANDLPEDINLVCRRSSDGGDSWGEIIEIVHFDEGGGYGDPVVMVDRNTGDVVVVCVHGCGLWASTNENPMRIVMLRSRDNGLTWEAPADITDMIYGKNAASAEGRRLHSAFAGSGGGVQFADGTLAFVISAGVSKNVNPMNNYVCLSKDGGFNWELYQQPAFVNGSDEAKIVELDNGDWLVSTRHRGNRCMTLKKKGETEWEDSRIIRNMEEPACDGDILKMPGGIILQSIPNNKERRVDVAVFASQDNGETWQLLDTPWKGHNSAYSAMAQINDNTFGLFTEVEVDPGKYYTMIFTRHKIIAK